MALKVEHELHTRRRSRNLGLLFVLLAFVALVFGLSIAKITNGDMMEAYDHQPRATLLPRDPNPPAPSATFAAPGTPGAAAVAEQEAPAAAEEGGGND